MEYYQRLNAVGQPIVCSLYLLFYFNPLSGNDHLFLPKITVTDPKQKMMLYMMPALFTYLSLGFPIRLVLYWVVNNVFSWDVIWLCSKMNGQEKSLSKDKEDIKRKEKQGQMKEIETTRRTVDEAVDKALEKLGISKNNAQIEVLSEQIRGCLGFGKQICPGNGHHAT